jgi:hypothetical protein
MRLFGRTLDLRVAIILLRSAVRTHGWVALPVSLRLIGTLLERQWSGVHPQPDDASHGDCPARALTLLSLADTHTVLADLRESTPWGGTGVTVGDVLRAWGGLLESSKDTTAINNVCRALHESEPHPGAIDLLRPVHVEALTLDRIIKGRFEHAPDLGPLLRVTRVLAQLPPVAKDETRPYLPREDLRETDGLSPDERREALAKLQSIGEWLNAEGLTDQLPTLMRRARRLQMPSFAEMLADVVPKAGDPLQPPGSAEDS